jgi:hypothetical protein
VLGCLAVNKGANTSGKYTTGYCKNKAKAATVIIIIIIFDEKCGETLQRNKQKKNRTSSKEQYEQIHTKIKKEKNLKKGKYVKGNRSFVTMVIR